MFWYSLRVRSRSRRDPKLRSAQTGFVACMFACTYAATYPAQFPLHVPGRPGGMRSLMICRSSLADDFIGNNAGPKHPALLHRDRPNTARHTAPRLWQPHRDRWRPDSSTAGSVQPTSVSVSERTSAATETASTALRGRLTKRENEAAGSSHPGAYNNSGKTSSQPCARFAVGMDQFWRRGASLF